MNARAPLWIPVLVGLLAILWIVPVVGLVLTSIRPAGDIAVGGWWSLHTLRFTLEAWQTVWTKYPLAPAFLSSLKLTGLATLLTVLLAPAAAYAFQFLKFPGRRILLLVIVNSFVLPQQVVIIPLFTLWRDLHMIDNVWAVLIPFVGLSFAWSIFLVQSFLAEFPRELIEASKIDGCTPIRTFLHVVLPNSLTPMATVGILQFLWCWNSMLLPMLYLRSDVPLTVLLARIAGSFEPNLDQQSVAAIVTMAVPLVVFIVFQRFFAADARNRSGGKE
ncbi:MULTISPECIES: carbohydrate ABC transporter permease [Rhizobium/Agrobacterium group]|uniref:sn-glycerol-3-phosphate transport system permease protein UgpE n=2 Tax=Rhizobium/Agrobacterium group TaxID=227290 RepID=B9K0B8_ALLAM|nr:MULTISPECIES: carbohydrate ABC transporter permease [Rhizobium/Agrobacterium group]ACM38316.1 ABC transporter membrane spanning protein [Allorhizobium ampelinum S4]MCF1445477.1 carbohydrate ABC transporter permease [Allorhizobium ampelinum]MCF1460488.1 carbohydrate ABC transporter permease [Allorhizobium ampelinum]MCF1472356.1 carbohydrate ABC transporter permease [Allorhizobium ampelinum]MCF1480807.1 carbohydrate ABC transporter permease [Allorhizobium ampelinum]